MSDHPFLVRIYGGDIVQAPRLRVRWRQVHRTKKIVAGMFREIEHDHWDHSHLDVVASRDYENKETAPEILRANGLRNRGGDGDVVPNNGDGLRKVARRIQEDDATAIAELDEQIEALLEAVRDLRAVRKDAVTAAWRRGKAILVHEVRPEDDKPRIVDA